MGFESDSESTPLTLDQEADLRRAATEDAASELADLDLAQSEVDRFYASPNAARAAVHLGEYEIATRLSAER